MEIVYLIIGLVLGGGVIYALKDGEIKRLRTQCDLVTGLLNTRMGHKPAVKEPDLAVEPTPEMPEYYEKKIQTLEREMVAYDDDMPDLLKRQETARALSEAKFQQQQFVEHQVRENSALPFQPTEGQ